MQYFSSPSLSDVSMMNLALLPEASGKNGKTVKVVPVRFMVYDIPDIAYIRGRTAPFRAYSDFTGLALSP